MSSTTTKARAIDLYPISVGLQPLAARWIVASHPDGTRWAIPAAQVLKTATAYYEREGWYEDEDDARDRGGREDGSQPTGKELRGIVEVNGDLEHHAKSERWSKFEQSAVLLAGPGTVPPHNDRLWWFEEEGGGVDEMASTAPAAQLDTSYGPLWMDDANYATYCARAWDEPARRLDLMRYFREVRHV